MYGKLVYLTIFLNFLYFLYRLFLEFVFLKIIASFSKLESKMSILLESINSGANIKSFFKNYSYLIHILELFFFKFNIACFLITII